MMADTAMKQSSTWRTRHVKRCAAAADWTPLLSLLLMLACESPGTAARPTVPDALRVPADQVLVVHALARGSQIYVCKAKADDATAFEWTLEAPEADLFGKDGERIGKHYRGPTWEGLDGSKVTGQLKAKVDAPSADAIPWLLLEAKSNEGSGTLSSVKSIQRVQTRGGKAPAAGCDASTEGTETRVEYTATYDFYAPKS